MGEKKNSDARIKANARYNDKAYDVLSIRVQKAERINERIDNAIQGTGISKAAFILDAIRAKLDSTQAPPDHTTDE